MDSQDSTSVEKNKAFFRENVEYARNVATLPTYENIRRVVDREIVGVRRLLDIGNGGVFDYDTDLVAEIVAVDLFLDAAAGLDGPSNVTFRHGDALSLAEPDASYDGVLLVLVLHHLVAATVEGTIANVRRAVAEARRVLEPRGRLIIVESCISTRAYSIERRLFALLRAVAATPLMKHPPTLQFPAHLIHELLHEWFEAVRVERIPVGRLVMQFGHRWPTALTPSRPYLFTAT